MYHVSILGLGLIGSRIARHMAGMGDKVTVWNRTPREDFPEAVPTPADAARASKIIQLYLKDRNACLEVFEQMRGALTPEHIILNHSTIDLATVGKLSLMSTAIGCTYVDCPFTGSRLPAEKGELVYYVGTDSTTLARKRPVLEHRSRDILHLRGAQGAYGVFWMHRHGDTVDGKSKGFQAVFGDLIRTQGAPGVADFNQPFADLLHADA